MSGFRSHITDLGKGEPSLDHTIVGFGSPEAGHSKVISSPAIPTSFEVERGSILGTTKQSNPL